MSENDDTNQDHDLTPDARIEPVEVPPAAAVFAPAAEAKAPWRDRVFRARAVAAVAVAGVILGAAGGAVTTALVSDDDGDRHERPAIGQDFGPGGMPAVPPDGRQDLPAPPGSDSDDSGSTSSSGSGTGQSSSYAQS